MSDEKAPPVPIPMLLHCPQQNCGARHVDVGEFATKIHHTHSCQICGHTWRPAVVPTVGVQFLPGFKNAPEGFPGATPVEVEIRSRRDKDWTLAFATALGFNSGGTAPLIPDSETIKKCFPNAVEKTSAFVKGHAAGYHDGLRYAQALASALNATELSAELDKALVYLSEQPTHETGA